jgi:hypothetical protein
MHYNKLFIFTIIASFLLPGMEKEDKPSLSSNLKEKVKSVISSLLPSTKTTPKQHRVKLTLLLQLKLKQINALTLLKAGQEIEVTNQAIKILQDLFIVFYTNDNTKKSIFPNTEKHTIKETGTYIVRNDSRLNTEYPIWEIKTYYGPDSFKPLISIKNAHHIEFYKIKAKHASIFKSYSEAKTTGYDLDLVYNEFPERNCWAFELTENNTPVIIHDNSAFEKHANRIIQYCILTNLQQTPDLLLALKRH